MSHLAANRRSESGCNSEHKRAPRSALDGTSTLRLRLRAYFDIVRFVFPLRASCELLVVACVSSEPAESRAQQIQAVCVAPGDCRNGLARRCALSAAIVREGDRDGRARSIEIVLPIAAARR